MNVHLQYYVKNVGNIQNDFKRVVEKIDHCEDDIGVLQQGQTNQEMFNRAILKRMREIEMKIEEQTKRIVSLEEEIATLCWKKACTCGEGKGKGVTIASTSGDQGDHIILNSDDSRDWTPISLLNLARQGLRDWRSKHQKSLLGSNEWNMIACTGARPLLLLSILQFRLEMSVALRENEEAICKS